MAPRLNSSLLISLLSLLYVRCIQVQGGAAGPDWPYSRFTSLSQESQQWSSFLSLGSCSHHHTNHSDRGMHELTGQDHCTEPFLELKHMYWEQGRNWMPWNISRCSNQKKGPGRGTDASPKRNNHQRARINPIVRKRLCTPRKTKILRSQADGGLARKTSSAKIVAVALNTFITNKRQEREKWHIQRVIFYQHWSSEFPSWWPNL